MSGQHPRSGMDKPGTTVGVISILIVFAMAVDIWRRGR